jgi:hypothetical protein
LDGKQLGLGRDELVFGSAWAEERERLSPSSIQNPNTNFSNYLTPITNQSTRQQFFKELGDNLHLLPEHLKLNVSPQPAFSPDGTNQGSFFDMVHADDADAGQVEDFQEIYFENRNENLRKAVSLPSLVHPSTAAFNEASLFVAGSNDGLPTIAQVRLHR